MPLPNSVRIAVAGIVIHAIDHLVVAAWPPFSWNVGTVYHLTHAPIYAALAYFVLRGDRWARGVITFLLAGQIIGRAVVWVLFPSSGAHAALLAGWALSAIILTLLWIPVEARTYFRKKQPVAHAD
ncbi:hypothetical protein [Nocardia arthritidis]|uniref:Uncharacterized protein n=1 Tax=Nocardia arthritidis TaxID=228602 RepID=A0A6G9YQC1_9NOCA|nr:hypothetical protein [Nocardia arthritidis]QIS15216.1 hypothetical protein F5544_36940 [Nocardia arthritidis]